MADEFAIHPAAAQAILNDCRNRRSDGAQLSELELTLLSVGEDRDNAYAIMDHFGINTASILQNTAPAGTA